jgi:competence protein ComEC
LQRLFQERRVKPDDLAAGDHFRLSRDVIARVLFPPPIFSARRADDQAHVIQVSIAPSTSVLFMSDNGVETESALLANGLNLHSDIIVKGQHHSGNSCSGPFLDAVRPRLIIATSRDFPPNERISDNWAEDLRTRGIKLFRQDESGAVTLRFGRDGWEAQSYLTGETFWSSSQ